MVLKPEAWMALAGWVLVVAGVWTGLGVSWALVTGGALLLSAVVARVKR